jgi:hypothetical protein
MNGLAQSEDIFWRKDWAKEKNDFDGNIVLYQGSSFCLYGERSMDVNIAENGLGVRKKDLGFEKVCR